MINSKTKFQRKQKLKGSVIDLTFQGLGVVKINNFPIFVANALIGEKIFFSLTRVFSHYAFGKLIKIIQKSPYRVDNYHPEMIESGIAPLVNLSYTSQLKYKQEQIKKLFHKFGLKNVKVLPTIGMKKPKHYRNKTVVPVKFDNDKNKLITGFYKRGSHKLVPIEDYFLNDPKIDKTVSIVRKILNSFHISAYSEITRKGILRYLMVRRGRATGQMMVGIVSTNKKLPFEREIVSLIRKKISGLASLILNYNPKPSNVQLGTKNRVLFGKQTIQDILLGYKFDISINSFYQVNPQTTAILYKKAADIANLKGSEVAVDAYSGIGTIGISISTLVKKVIGVEIISQAVKNAKKNLLINNIKNVHYINADASKQFTKWSKDKLKPDIVFVDPPRKGLDPKLINSLVKTFPKKILYISCNPTTLARDSYLLTKRGYFISKPVQPIDQFPQTMHVESITLFLHK